MTPEVEHREFSAYDEGPVYDKDYDAVLTRYWGGVDTDGDGVGDMVFPARGTSIFAASTDMFVGFQNTGNQTKDFLVQVSDVPRGWSVTPWLVGLATDRIRSTYYAAPRAPSETGASLWKVRVGRDAPETATVRFQVLSTDSGQAFDEIAVTLHKGAVSASGDDDEPVTALNEALLEQVAPELVNGVVGNLSSRIETSLNTVLSGGLPADGTFRLAGRSSLEGMMMFAARTLDRTVDLDQPPSLEEVLDGSSFTLPLGAAMDGGDSPFSDLALWGSGDYGELSGGEGARSWSGSLTSVHVGADTRLRPDLLAGLSVSWSQGAFDFTDRSVAAAGAVEGEWKMRMTSVSPYAGWSASPELDLWALAGYGRGKVEIEGIAPEGVEESDTSMKLAAVGANRDLVSRDDVVPGGTTTLALKGEASGARVDIADNGGLIRAVETLTTRLRLGLDGSHERVLPWGGALTPSLELGLRHDGGDGDTGTGAEIGAGLRYTDPASGVTVSVRGRWLATHSGDGNAEEWGAGGLVRFDPGAHGRGLSLHLAPAWGKTASGVRQLWERRAADLRVNGGEAPARLEAELGYGLRAVGGWGVLTPFGALTLSGADARRYGLGARLHVGPFGLDLEGERRESAGAALEHAATLRGVLRF